MTTTTSTTTTTTIDDKIHNHNAVSTATTFTTFGIVGAVVVALLVGFVTALWVVSSSSFWNINPNKKKKKKKNQNETRMQETDTTTTTPWHATLLAYSGHEPPPPHSLRADPNDDNANDGDHDNDGALPPLLLQYDIFISHAGEQKQSLAWFLYDALRTRGNRFPFLDQASLQLGGHSHQAMEYAMQTCPVGLFVLSPEFVAKKYPVKELDAFLQRVPADPNNKAAAPAPAPAPGTQQDPQQSGCRPQIVPIFFGLSHEDCGMEEEAFFHKFRSVFDNPAYEFAQREARGEISKTRVMELLRRVRTFTGVVDRQGPHQIVQDTVQKLRRPTRRRRGAVPVQQQSQQYSSHNEYNDDDNNEFYHRERQDRPMGLQHDEWTIQEEHRLDYGTRCIGACRKTARDLEYTIPTLPLLNSQLRKKANDMQRAIRDLLEDAGEMQHQIDDYRNNITYSFDSDIFRQECDDLNMRRGALVRQFGRFRQDCESAQQYYASGLRSANPPSIQRNDDEFLPLVFDSHEDFLTQLLIDGHNKRFASGTRQRVFEHVERWLANPWQLGEVSNGLVLASTAGMGKTAIAAQVVKRYGEWVVAKHFCRHTQPAQSTDKQVVLSIAGQVTERLGDLYPMYKPLLVQYLRQTGGTYNGSLLRGKFLHGMQIDAGRVLEDVLLNPLTELMNNNPAIKTELEKFCVVIDALDEAKPDLVRCIRNHFIRLPFKIFVTSRPETLILKVDKIVVDGDNIDHGHEVREEITQGILKGFNPVTIDKDMLDNKEDLRIALRQSRVLHRIEELSFREDVISSIIEKGEANFEYARMAIDTIASTLDQRKDIQIDSFPQGIDASHTAKFAAIFGPSYAKDSRFRDTKTWKAIMCMVAAAEPLPVPLLKRLLHVDESRDMDIILNTIKSLFHVRGQHIQAFHKSVTDFLTDNKKSTNGRFHVSMKEATNLLARECWRVVMESRAEMLQMSSQYNALTDNYLVLSYVKKHAVRHMLDSSILRDSDDIVYARETEFQVFEFLKDVAILWDRANSTDSLLNLALEYIHFGTWDCKLLHQGTHDAGTSEWWWFMNVFRKRQRVGISERRFIALMGRALQGSQPRCRAGAVEELPGQLVGRLLGPMEWQGGEHKKYYNIGRMLLHGDWKTLWSDLVWLLISLVIETLLAAYFHSNPSEEPGRMIDRRLRQQLKRKSGEERQVKDYVSKMLRDWKKVDFGFSWWCPKKPLWEQANDPCMMSIVGHSDDVTSIAISPDNRQMASGSSDKTVRLWNAMTGEIIQVLQGHTRHINSVSWSPDGSKVASGSDDGTVRIWNASTGETTLVVKTSSVLSVSWSPDGSQLASGSVNKTVCLWNATKGEKTVVLKGHTDNVNSVSWSPDGKQLVSGADDRTVRIWNVLIGQTIHVLRGHKQHVRSVSWSPDGNQVASGSDDDTLRIWNASTGKAIHVLQSTSHDVCSVCWSPNGRQLASALGDWTIRLWDTVTGDCTHIFEGHTKCVNSVFWSSDGSQLASGSDDCSIRIWDATSGVSSSSVTPEADTPSKVHALSWSPDGSRVASQSRDVHIWNASTGQTTLALSGPSFGVASSSWSPDGSQIAAGGVGDGTVYLWDALTGKTLFTWQGHGDHAPVNTVAWSPDGSQVASGSSDSTVHIGNALTGKTIHVLKGHSGAVTAVAYSPDGSQVASKSRDRPVRRPWDEDLLSEELLDLTDPAHSSSEREDGSEVSEDNVVRVTHSFSFWHSPEASAGSSEDDTVRVWNTATGELIRVLRGREASNPHRVFGRSTAVDNNKQGGLHSIVGADCQFFSDNGTNAAGVHNRTDVVFFDLVHRPLEANAQSPPISHFSFP